MPAEIKIDLFSDVVCPWCYIGARRFDTAREALAHPTDGSEPVKVSLTLHAFQLDPDADPERTEPAIDAYARKFGGLQQATKIIEQVTTTAAADGLEFHMERAQRANTLRAHRLIWWAGHGEHQLDAWTTNNALMAAYFTEGKNISNIDTLADIAATLGADRDTVTTMLNGNLGNDQVAADLSTAASVGVTAVPTFIVNQQWSIPGAQDADTLIRVLRRVAQTGA